MSTIPWSEKRHDIYEAGVWCANQEFRYDEVEDKHYEVWRAMQEGSLDEVLFKVPYPSASRWDVLHQLADHPKMRGSALARLSEKLLSGDAPLLDTSPREGVGAGELARAINAA